jgi:HD-like signal output (HDOD) protein
MATHADVGQWLLQKWHFPPTLVDAIQHHHHPALAKQAPMETAIVHVSDILARAKGVGYAGDCVVPALDATAWDTLDLSDEDIHDILTALEDAVASTREES